LQLGQQAADHIDLVAQPQAHVGGDLVVARAAGVQALAGIAQQLGQAGLDVQVHVLQVELPLEAAASISRRDGGMPSWMAAWSSLLMMPWWHNISAWASEPADVHAPQAFVEKHAGGVALDEVAHGLGEQGRPGSRFLVELVLGHGSGKLVGPGSGPEGCKITNNQVNNLVNDERQRDFIDLSRTRCADARGAAAAGADLRRLPARGAAACGAVCRSW
jgi:hypothetical protein